MNLRSTLAGLALTLLVSTVVHFAQTVGTVSLAVTGVHLLDQALLVLLIVEVLYTVQVSFREHALVPEPFLLVGLIACIRRVLVVTASFGEARDKTPTDLEHLILELAALTALILALAISLLLLRKKGEPVVVPRT